MADYHCALCGRDLWALSATAVRVGETNVILCGDCEKRFRQADDRARLELLEELLASETLEHRDEVAAGAAQLRALLEERARKYTCCGQAMRYCGKLEFQLGSYGFFTGDLGNLLSGSKEMSVFFCETCGQFKFYDPRYVEQTEAAREVSRGEADAAPQPPPEEAERPEPEEKQERRGWFGRKKDKPDWEF